MCLVDRACKNNRPVTSHYWIVMGLMRASAIMPVLPPVIWGQDPNNYSLLAALTDVPQPLVYHFLTGWYNFPAPHRFGLPLQLSSDLELVFTGIQDSLGHISYSKISCRNECF